MKQEREIEIRILSKVRLTMMVDSDIPDSAVVDAVHVMLEAEEINIDLSNTDFEVTNVEEAYSTDDNDEKYLGLEPRSI